MTKGERVKRFRKRKGLSLRALEEKCGLSFALLSLIERGKTPISNKSARRLAKAMNLKRWDLLCD